MHEYYPIMDFSQDPDNTIRERFPREKYIINLVHNMSNA